MYEGITIICCSLHIPVLIVSPPLSVESPEFSLYLLVKLLIGLDISGRTSDQPVEVQR